MSQFKGLPYHSRRINVNEQKSLLELICIEFGAWLNCMVELYNITYGGFINGDKVEPVKLLINDRYEEFRLQRLSFFLSYIYIYFFFLFWGGLWVLLFFILPLTIPFVIYSFFFFFIV